MAPGVQVSTQADGCSPSMPSLPKQVQPWPGVASSLAWAAAAFSGGTAKMMAWCTIGAFCGWNWLPGQECRCGELWVEDHAAVFVGAGPAARSVVSASGMVRLTNRSPGRNGRAGCRRRTCRGHVWACAPRWRRNRCNRGSTHTRRPSSSSPPHLPGGASEAALLRFVMTPCNDRRDSLATLPAQRERTGPTRWTGCACSGRMGQDSSESEASSRSSVRGGVSWSAPVGVGEGVARPRAVVGVRVNWCARTTAGTQSRRSPKVWRVPLAETGLTVDGADKMIWVVIATTNSNETSRPWPASSNAATNTAAPCSRRAHARPEAAAATATRPPRRPPIQAACVRRPLRRRRSGRRASGIANRMALRSTLDVRGPPRLRLTMRAPCARPRTDSSSLAGVAEGAARATGADNQKTSPMFTRAISEATFVPCPFTSATSRPWMRA